MFEDSRIGIEGKCGELLINLEVDEDCESTSSIVRFGRNLCYEDLNACIQKNQNDGYTENGSEDY